MVKRLYRSRRERMLAGVCAGIAHYANMDPTVVRLLWVLATLFPGTTPLGLFGYLVAWLLIPEEPA
jgi:phage shock protein C